MRHFGSSLFVAFAPVRAGVATRKRISAAALGSLLLGGALLPRSVGADVSIAGDWVGKGKCQVVDKLNGHSPVKLSEDVQLTFNSDANATSARQVFMHGRFSTADFGAFQVFGFLVGSNPPGADAFVGYFEADPPGCAIPGPEDVLFGTVKKGKMKLLYVTSSSAAKFGTCTFALKQTSTTASASPCP